MELNQIFLWMTIVPCGAIVIQALRAWPRVMRGWIIVALGILVVTLSVYLVKPTIAGYPGILLVGAFVMAPSLLSRRLRTLSLMQRLDRAVPLANLLAALHPWDGFREQPLLLGAIAAAEAGRIDEAIGRLEALRHSRVVGDAAMMHQLRIRGLWEQLVAVVDLNFDARMLADEGQLLPLYLRGLGEIGELNTLVEMFDQTAGRNDSGQAGLTRDLCRMSLFAFCGQPDMLEALFRGGLADVAGPVQEFWQATAILTAGNRPAAERRLRMLMPEANELLKRAIERRLAFPLPDPKLILTPASREVLARADREREQEHRFAAMRTIAGRRPIATHALIAINVFVFLIEVARGGSENERVLNGMGALLIYEVRQGQWWRIIAANFLHYGPMHLGMNMIGLYILGPFVEATLGRVRYLAIYLLSGILAMVGVLAIASFRVKPPDGLVGASGAIMGLIGATGAILLVGWIREGARAARAQLPVVLALVVLQVVFDAMTPEVSSTAHLLGLASGFVLALPLIPRKNRAATIAN